jgi:hypothetical protein
MKMSHKALILVRFEVLSRDYEQSYRLVWCHLVRWKSTDIAEEHVASIFGTERKAKKETNMKQAAKESEMSFRNVRWLSMDYMA